jgi:predicted phage terminase large subunit-like protein
MPRYRTAAHHRVIAGHLERIERGEIDRLMLLVPPRHGKSELASHRFPAWYLGRQPHSQFLSVSATESLATDFGRAVRNTIGSLEYRAIFDTTLAEDSQAKGKWHTSQDGIYYALGIGGSILGRGGDCILIDDPYASMQEAMSDLVRKNVWDWYSGTAYNRLMPGGKIVLINHRMHEDDLSGMLLAQQAAGGDQWTVVELPAITESGEALWDDAYPIEALERIRRNTQARFWSALYQQKPTPDEGTYWRSDWLRPYTVPPDPATMRVYGGSDYAVSEEDGADYTVHAVIGIDPENRMYLLDIWRRQASSEEWVEAFCDLVRQHKPLGWAEEQGQIKSGIGPWLTNRQRARQAYVHREPFPTRFSKEVRAQSMRGRIALDGLYVPTHAPWYPAFRSELLSFPAGKHDDQVDAIGLIGQLLDKMSAGVAPKPKAPEPIKFKGYRSSAPTGESFKAY